MTATEAGSRNVRTAAVAARRSRSSKRASAFGQRRRQLDLDPVGRGANLGRKAAAPEHLDHPMVGREHLGRERADAVLLGDCRQMREQDRGDPPSLPRVRDQECDLGTPRRVARAEPDVRCVGDDPPRRARLDDQREAVGVIDVDRPVGDPVEVDCSEEPEGDRLLGDAVEKRPDRGLVVEACRPDVDGRPVGQRDLRLALGGVCGFGLAHPLESPFIR